jgi:putative peptide zinc metalloprotease protein
VTGPVPAPRAKLELLIRGDDDGFEVRQVSSAVAWLEMRTHRLPDDAWELAEVISHIDGKHRFILKNIRTDRFLMLSEPERFLWGLMDGQTSLQDMATAYVLRYGAFDFDLIPALIRKLQRADLLTLQPASALRRVLARNRRLQLVKLAETLLLGLERVNVSSRDVHTLFSRVYAWGGWLLFTRLALVTCLALGAAGMVAGVRLWFAPDAIAHGLGTHPVLAILGVKLLFFATLLVHQLGHGLALVHYGRRVREFGFTFLHGFVPSFYVDVTDIFMVNRRARVVTALAGALVHLALGALWFLVAVASPSGFMKAFAAASGIIQWQAFVLALYPCCFIEMDGYHIMVDMLGQPTLKSDALAYAGSLLRGRPNIAWGRQAQLMLGYLVVSTVSLAALIAFNVWLVVTAVT